MRIQTPALVSIASLLLCAPVAASAQTFEVVQQPQKKSTPAAKPAASEKKAVPVKSSPVKNAQTGVAGNSAAKSSTKAGASTKTKTTLAAKKKKSAPDTKNVAAVKPVEPAATEMASAPAPKKEEVVPPPAPFKSTLPGSVIVTGEDVEALRAQIQGALQRDASLRGSALNVSINDKGVQLTGSVNSGKERVAARRIAQSYSGNRRVEDKINVLGQADAQVAQKQSANNTDSSDAAGNLPQSDQGAAKKKTNVAPLLPKADVSKPKVDETRSTPPPVKAQ